MKDRGWKILLLVAGLLGLAVIAATAQIGDQDPCRTGCRETHARCVTTCGQHSDPIGCEERCTEEAQQCESSCRQ